MLDPVELRIAEALQIDPRASWRRIARALGEHERLIARRGTALLASGRVVVAGVRARGTGILLRAACHPGARLAAVEALAARRDATFSYVLSGAYDVAAEIWRRPAPGQSPYTLDVSITPGLARAETLPILRYFRTIRGWRLGVLSQSESSALSGGPADAFPEVSVPESGSAVDQAIMDALTADARMSAEELARRAGVSESTVRRRLDVLRETNQLSLRAIVEPAQAGLHTEALLWLSTAPHLVGEVGRAIAADGRARYVAAVAGSCQIVADITVGEPHELYTYLTESSWAAQIHSMDISLVAGARKRGGQLLRMPGFSDGQPVASS
ncbi:AsnC family transcriptional regulator [Sediminivirga luteola]|uniref:AsnC family transcriptional regulator n=1 Tax=Sediminivirga luteola TaxID=1774748 RepID=A0A8J2XKZ9_9MICO|nr:AsnC family transcriptional regulator [Sediminivirga luteola]GGA14045.1 AsnC family transcriptional regulator [Sediminivirga luteola]